MKTGTGGGVGHCGEGQSSFHKSRVALEHPVVTETGRRGHSELCPADVMSLPHVGFKTPDTSQE
jgi:hypothetical protein